VTAIRKHLADFLAIIALFAISMGVAAYILSNQRLRFPIVEDKPFQLKAEFSDAQAVIPGQGQSVRVAGVQVGEISKVQLQNGRAYVTMDLEKKHSKLVHEDAFALLRPKTGLKDMFIELEPGTGRTPVLEENEVVPVRNTAPDIDPDEVLSALDGDTRDYLKLLISGAGKGLDGRADDLREVFKRFEPLHRDIKRVSTAVATRRENMARLVHNYGSLMDELGDKDKELTKLVEASNAVFQSFANQDTNISESVAKLPGALRETESTLRKADTFAKTAGPTFEALRPVFRKLDEANKEVLPFVKEAAPITEKQIRPFVRGAREPVRDLRPAATDLAAANPDLTRSFHELNRFFNMASYNPGGKEKLSGPNDTNRDEGYLFWAAWVGHITNSLFSTADSTGPFRRSLFAVNCNTLRDSVLENAPELEVILGVTDLLNDPGLCPKAGN
jgi:phospholipid/cholesterol/gamma-HCH transport system substrate-binding protein